MKGHIKNGLIAFFDILGFKDLVSNNSHVKLSALYHLLFEFMVRQKSIGLITENQESHKYFNSDETIPIKSIIISDSIILWSESATINEFTQLLIIIESLLQLGFSTGLPLRGAITSGEFSAVELTGNFTIFGKALTHSYMLEANQNWSGCLVDKKTIDHIKSISPKTSLEDKVKLYTFNNIVNYPIPLKNNEQQSSLAINWIGSQFDKDSIQASFSSHLKSSDNNKVQTLIENTLNFGNHCLKLNESDNREVLKLMLDDRFLKLYDLANKSS